MPKLTSRPTSHYAGYNPLPVTLAAPTDTMAAYYNARGQPAMASYYTTGGLATSAPQAPLAVGSYHDPYAVAPPLAMPTGDAGMGGHLPTQHRSSSGAWSFNDDQTLLQARAKGDNWAKIQSDWFPTKTANAFRGAGANHCSRAGEL